MGANSFAKMTRFEQLPTTSPIGIPSEDWHEYRCHVLQVGVLRARKPHPHHVFWKKVAGAQHSAPGHLSSLAFNFKQMTHRAGRLGLLAKK